MSNPTPDKPSSHQWSASSGQSERMSEMARQAQRKVVNQGMSTNTMMLIGGGLIAAAAYYYWPKKEPTMKEQIAETARLTARKGLDQVEHGAKKGKEVLDGK